MTLCPASGFLGTAVLVVWVRYTDPGAENTNCLPVTKEILKITILEYKQVLYGASRIEKKVPLPR